LPAAIEARERAYGAAVKTGDFQSAVVAAIQLGRDNIFRNAHSLGAAWLNRAERMLEGQPDNLGHGWLAVTRAFQAAEVNRFDDALAYIARAREIAELFADRDLGAASLSCEGLARVFRGELQEGLAALDEASLVAMAGELEPQTAGGVACTTISACAILGDWQRATHWTEAQDRWCQRERINGFPGMCRLYRAESKRLRGSWLEAEAEARRATDELEGFIPAAVGIGHYEIGMIRLRRGDLPAAEDAFLKGHAYNRSPEPGLSLVRLAQGRLAAASDSIRRALDDPEDTPSYWAPPGSEINRLALLPAQIEIALAAGDVGVARAAADELETLAQRFDSVAVRASAATGLGAVLVAEGELAAGAVKIRRGIELWAELDAPYEAARARLTLAEAYAADGARDRAALELQAARAVLERLGAAVDLRKADELGARIGGGSDVRPVSAEQQRLVRTFVFTDIVDSTRLAELLGDEAWQNLIRWHDQTMRSLVAEHRGEEIKAIGDGFFLAFEDADQALGCAIAIQRRLTEQRQAQGFAPAVRIGVHRAEAQRAGLDYLGTGVNTAARVGAQAAGGEILVSAATLASVRGEYEEAGRRTAELKGISAPVEVVSIAWR
jgi:class 3 adenylate cyclase